MEACIHGEVCRAYLDKFGKVRAGRYLMGSLVQGNTQWCILSATCPHNCDFYEPENPKGLHFKERA